MNDSESASPASALETPDPLPLFPRSPGETPRAYGAFVAFFQLGQTRSLPALADQTGEGLPTIKNWASKYRWSERIQSYHSGLLQQQVADHLAGQRNHAALWTQRLHRLREQEWDAAQKLSAAAQCFLETFGEEDLRHMTLAQASRALQISSAISRLALAETPTPQAAAPELSPAQQQLLDAVKRVYNQPPPATPPATPPPAPPDAAPAPAPLAPAQEDLPNPQTTL